MPIFQTSFGVETSGSIAKCRLFSQANLAARFLILHIFLPLSVMKVEGGKEKRFTTWGFNSSAIIINNYQLIYCVVNFADHYQGQC